MGSGPSKQELHKLNVVIIGAGYGGIQAAVELKKAGVSYKLIDPKEYFHHCLGALRATVDAGYAKRVAIPLREAFGDNFIQGKVASLDTENKLVQLEGGQELKFTHCIIAVGSLGPVPARTKQVTMAGLMEEYSQLSQQVKKAIKIVVVGGGPVGVELAGEIRELYKSVEIVLVSSSKDLVNNTFGDKFQANLKYRLENSNIKVEYGRVMNLKELTLNAVKRQEVKLDSGTSIQADLVFSCIGLPTNKQSTSLLVPDKIDENGRIKVDKYLQVEGHAHILAIGDCCNTPENKMAAYAGKHGELVVANILTEASNSGRKKRAYVTPFVGMVLPLGKSAGVGNMGGWNIPSFAVAKLKSQDLFTSKYWSAMGVKIPA